MTASGIAAPSTPQETQEPLKTERRAVPLLFQGSVRWGTVPGRPYDVERVHAQAVVCADALEADIFGYLRRRVLEQAARRV